jgi:hypothetical protein
MVFLPALREMEHMGSETFGPESFRDYQAKHGLTIKGNAPAYISVDQLRSLKVDLREAQTMVFRLGRAQAGAGTAFALSRLRNDWSDFFINDQRVFEESERKQFFSGMPAHQLLPFKLLPKLTETSLVNLAAAVGLLGKALNIDPETPASLPGTGRSTFSFAVTPHGTGSPIWEHRSGQVEVDAIFVGRRKNVETVFILEAKATSNPGTLAKHKLVYPYAALRPQIPSNMQVVPVYLRAWVDGPSIYFNVVECTPPAAKDGASIISSLEPLEASIWKLRL